MNKAPAHPGAFFVPAYLAGCFAVVTRVTHRVFGKEQWANLRARLDVWRENLAGAAGEVSKALDAGAEALVAH